MGTYSSRKCRAYGNIFYKEYREYGSIFYKEYIEVVFPCSRLRTSGDILTVRPVVPSRDVKLPLVVYFPGFRAKALQTSPDEL